MQSVWFSPTACSWHSGTWFVCCGGRSVLLACSPIELRVTFASRLYLKLHLSMNIDARALKFSHNVVLRGTRVWDTGCFLASAACRGCSLVLLRNTLPKGCFLLLLSKFFFTFLLLLRVIILLLATRGEHFSEKTRRVTGLKNLLNIVLVRTHVWFVFSWP